MLKLNPFKRYEKNPIIQRHDIPYPCNTVFNAAACKYKQEYILLLRVEDRRGYSHLTLARSRDGYEFKVDDKPWICSSEEPEFHPFEVYGVEDPRITFMEEEKVFYITYTAYGIYGPRVGIGKTKDFRNFERIGIIGPPDNKDAVLFSEKIEGQYVLLDRPGGVVGAHAGIWINYSYDLIYWKKKGVILAPEPGWGHSKLGMCMPPIKTEKGWLCLYHGVKVTPAGRIYRIGAMLLDQHSPEKVIGYTSHFIFGPERYYERTGDVPNVVFPCGAILEPDGTLKMYYGAADTCIAIAEADIEEIIGLCIKDGHNIC